MFSEKRIFGNKGEDIACKFLMKHGFTVIQRNYLRKWGEIDIVAKKSGVLHFVEVKTVSRENLENVSYETDEYRPEDNLHPAKLKRMARVIEVYLLDKNVSDETEWFFDALIVYLDLKNKVARVKMLENIVL